MIIEEDAINSILSSSDIEEMPLSFNAIYETDPNDLGWFIQEKIRANGAKVNQDGQLKHYTCFTNSENCITSSRTLDALRNASKRFFPAALPCLCVPKPYPPWLLTKPGLFLSLIYTKL